MENQFHLDLAQYSLDKFRRSLAAREVIPSRVILKEDLEARFATLARGGISNLQELSDRLGSKAKIELFAAESGLSIQYLTILKREAGSYRPKPIRLDKFPGIAPDHVHRLAAAGLKNSHQLFNLAAGKAERAALARRTGLPLEIMDELVCLADLGRAYGVGPVFARLLYDVGIRTIQELVAVTAAELIRIYEAKEGKKADFGVHEIQFTLELAKELGIAVEL